MSALRAAAVAALALLAAVPATAEVGVWIDYPTGLEPAIGPLEIAAAVETGGTTIAAVQFLVDGELVAVVSKPPYRALVDVGYENVEHQFEVVVRTAAGETARASLTTPKIKVDDEIELHLQQLYVTVTEGGRRVLGLERGDFRVLDEGDRQEIVTFERGDVPLTAVLLLDSSLSMRGERQAAALNGASVFLRSMKPLDEAMVVLFSDRLLRATPFASDPEPLLASLDAPEAAGGTAINDHLFMALGRLDERQGRRVVVLFSDGADVHSALSMKEVLRRTQSSPALIYWIHLVGEHWSGETPGYTTGWRDESANRLELELLGKAVQESGGRVQIVHDPDGLEAAFSEILAELREQYVLGYYPSDVRGDGRWRDVDVRVRGGGLRVRSRDGYRDD